jgi:toxin-antitoxin system PIN domain toxin
VVSIGLLDVIALIALLWEEHPFHEGCATWFAKAAKTGWATCPITEAGFVRIVCSPAFTARPPSVHNAIGLLRAVTESASNHHFWNDELPISVIGMRWKPPLCHKQVTDLYLLPLAIHNKGTLVTFDQRIANTAALGNIERGALHLLKA